VASTLFVAHQNVAQLLRIHERVIDRKNGTARQTEYIGHPEKFERTNDCLGT
jgi:hypothetical protein